MAKGKYKNIISTSEINLEETTNPTAAANTVNLAAIDNEKISIKNSSGEEIILDPSVDPAATESVPGTAELATQTETDDGTDDVRIVTPLKLAKKSTDIPANKATSFTVVYAEANNLLRLNAGSAQTLTLPQTSTETIPDGFGFSASNNGTATWTIATEGTDVSSGFMAIAAGETLFIQKVIEGTPNTWKVYSSDLVAREVSGVAETAVLSDDMIRADTSSNDMAITLFDVTTRDNKQILVKKTSSLNTLTIPPDGSDTIDGQSSLVITPGGSPLPSLYLIADETNTNWDVVPLTAAAPQARKELGDDIITPAAFTVQTDNFNPTGLDTAAVIRISSTTGVTLTGIVAQTDNPRIELINVGANDITLANASGSSTAGNRFVLNADLTLKANHSARLFYDETSVDWRVNGAQIN